MESKSLPLHPVIVIDPVMDFTDLRARVPAFTGGNAFKLLHSPGPDKAPFRQWGTVVLHSDAPFGDLGLTLI